MSIKKQWWFKNIDVLVILLPLLYVWSWLLTIQVVKITPSVLVGRIIAITVYLIIVSISTFIFVLILRYIKKYKNENPWKNLFRFWLSWAAAELIVSWLISIIWIGRNGSWDTVLPFSSLTPFLMYTPLAYLSRFVGFHGLSALFITVVYGLINKKTRSITPIFIVGILISSLIAWKLYVNPVGDTVKATIVAETITEHVPKINTNSDIVIFPEYGLDGLDSSTLNSRVVGNKNQNITVIGSKQIKQLDGIDNVLVYAGTSNGIFQTITKSRLIPGGEYMPYMAELLLKLFKQQDTLNIFNFSRAIKKGNSTNLPFKVSNNLKIGSGVCASIISTNDYRQLVNKGATILTNSASLGIFSSDLFNFEHKGMVKFMAISNARPFLQSTSSHQGLILDHNGNEKVSVQPVDKKDFKTTTNSRKTPYTLIGEFVAYLGIIYIFVGIYNYFVYKNKNFNKDKL